MNSQLVQLMAVALVMVLLMEVTLVTSASIPVVGDFDDEMVDSVPSNQMPRLPNNVKSSNDREGLEGELGQQLLILRAAEQNIMRHIEALEARQRALRQRKRSHFTNMCMFNVVACYRRRK